MRAMLSIASLLVVLFVVWQLAGRQVRQAVRTESGPSTAEAAAAKVQQAIEQAAAARASEALAK